ncbi:hypothetical protein ACFXAZ_24670 [Streptomyces sp. NPDC059477]|uniref:hypothetical protein n=1 Tax=Streptomyces sp. NPDC059477 TaxID=3346847 RepID=UPI0036811E32
MTESDGGRDTALPAFERPVGCAHPVIAEVLAELRARENTGEPDFAYFRDSPDPPPPQPPPPQPQPPPRPGGRS